MASLNDFGLNGAKSAGRHALWAIMLCVCVVAGSGCATVKTIQGAPKALLPASCKTSPATARCQDGEVLALRRYQIRDGGTRPGAVVLCHGIGENGNIFDLGNGNSLARYLAGEGLDVLPWDGAEQQEFQHFVVWQGCGATLHEAGAQAFPMV